MDVLISLAFLAFFGYWFWRIVRAISRRTSLMHRLKKLCERLGYRMRRTRNPVASFFGAGALPDVVISTDDKEYCIRFVTSINRAKFFYFASEEYAVSYQRGAVALPFAKSADIVTMQRNFHYFPKKTLPDFLEGKQGVQWILLFNPAPAEVESINSEKTKRYVVGNGDPIGEAVAYDGRSFCEKLCGN